MFKTLNLRKLIISLVIPFATACISQLLIGDGMEDYASVTTPPLSPPSVVFPIVWTILFLLMGLALYNVSNTVAPQPKKSLSYIVFGIQLFFNFAWTILFFVFKLYTVSSVWLAMLIVLIAVNIAVFERVKKLSAYMLIPYLVWCIFALYLNIGVAYLN